LDLILITRQRAYRERRGRETQELEQRNKLLQEYTGTLLEENERLKGQLLQLTAGQNLSTEDPAACSSLSPASSATEYCPSTTTTKQHDKEFLDVKEAWDLIQDHCLYKRGQIRIEDIYRRLREKASVSVDGM